MININENIRRLRKQQNWTQDQFAQQLNIKRSLVGAYEEGRAEPRLELLQRMAAVFKITVDQLIGKEEIPATAGIIGTLENTEEKFTRGKDIRIVTMDSQQKDNIELVPHKAAAGYINGFADEEFVRELPKFKLPILSTGTYRAFEISGDSMLPILPGTIVVGEYIEDLRQLKNGKTYILVTQREGIVYKRVFNYINENGKLFLVSDNRQYAPYQLNAEDIVEAWAAKAYISVQFPDVESKNDVSVENLAGLVLDLQKEILEIKSDKKKN
jgi:transcriptional regulator with XRE-family HTH domain